MDSKLSAGGDEDQNAVNYPLMVPSVQELVNKNPSSVPPRYIHTDLEPTFESDDGQLPVISLQSLINGDLRELQKLHLACHQWGFFQLVNHGVCSLLIEKLRLEATEFFHLPMEEKKKYWRTPDDLEGFGQHFVMSEEQRLDWGDVFCVTTYPKCTRKPHLIPMLPLPFRDTFENYTAEMKSLAMVILNFMEKGLKMEDGELLKELLGDGKQVVRINYYPPCPNSDKVIGFSPHADSTAITILLQLNQVEGLQVRKDGKWIPVNPPPNALVVNIGCSVEIITNGIYPSMEHRVMVDQSRERLSLATFYHFSPSDGEIGPHPCLITPERPAQFRRIKLDDFYKSFYLQKLAGKSYLDPVRISHDP